MLLWPLTASNNNSALYYTGEGQCKSIENNFISYEPSDKHSNPCLNFSNHFYNFERHHNLMFYWLFGRFGAPKIQRLTHLATSFSPQEYFVVVQRLVRVVTNESHTSYYQDSGEVRNFI